MTDISVLNFKKWRINTKRQQQHNNRHDEVDVAQRAKKKEKKEKKRRIFPNMKYSKLLNLQPSSFYSIYCSSFQINYRKV